MLKFAFGFKYHGKIDCAIIINESFRTALLAFLLGTKKRVGRSSENRGFLLTHKIPYTKEEQELKVHCIEYTMRVLKPLNLYKSDCEMSFSYSDDNSKYIDKILDEYNCNNSELIGFCPCSSMVAKDWNPEEAAKFIKLINNAENKKIVLIGTEAASDFAEKIREFGVNDFIDLTCKTSIPELAALISRLKAMVTVDTGSMHLGFTYKIPSICLFFQNTATRWGPRDLDINRVIYDPNDISAQRAFEELNDVFTLN